MYQQGLRDEIRRISLITISAAALGLLAGELRGALLIAGFCYCCWLLYQTKRFYDWLESNMENTPPDSSGIWGDIVQTLYQIRQKNIRTQNEMQAQINRIQGFTSALRSGIIILNNNGNMGWWNDSAGTLLGLHKQYDLNKPIVNLLRDPQFIEYFYRANENETITIPSPVDPHIQVQIQITPYGKNEKLVSVHNITRLKQLEQTRKDFVANVSHELRTPLTVINGFLEPLCDHLDSIDPQWHEPLNKIHNQARRMTDLVNDLSILSRLDNAEKTDRKDRINLQAMLRRISDETRQVNRNKTVDIEMSGEPLILIGSETELYSCFSNLIHNAVKYSKPGGVSIRLHTRQDDAWAYVEISDNGMGIDPGHLPRLTERFYRVDSSHSRATGGSGLGLAIVKHTLQRHDGKLMIHSRVGHGSTFSCQFSKQRVVADETNKSPATT